MNEADWVTAAVLHERYLKDVYHYVLRRVPRPDEAEDITSEVFAAAFAALPRFRGQCPPYLWLLSIARHKIVDWRRRRSARRETLASELGDRADEIAESWEQALLRAGEAAGEAPQAALERGEARRVLHTLMAELNEDQREALVLKYGERLTMAEIAVVMGRSAAAVNSLLQRARAALYDRGRGYFLEDDEDQSHD
jgi:RNA polymerase sigma-70 factor (ECF subfamily)